MVNKEKLKNLIDLRYIESEALDQLENILRLDFVEKVGKDTLDESPNAYKKLESVIEMQKGVVVDVIDVIKPIINVKG